MIVADTSVWVEYLRNTSAWQVGRLDDLLRRERVVVGDVVLMEVLLGVASEAAARETERLLRLASVVPMLDPTRAARAAANYRALRRLGVTIRSSADLVIGTYCLDEGLPLLHRDRDYDAMARHLGLRVVEV